MSQDVVNFTLPSITQGDRWIGINSIGPVTFDNLQPSVQLERIRIQFRYAQFVFTLDSSASADRDGPITISNATTWLATVPPVESGFCSQASGQWFFDIEFYGVGQGAQTLVKGSICVNPQVTL